MLMTKWGDGLGGAVLGGVSELKGRGSSRGVGPSFVLDLQPWFEIGLLGAGSTAPPPHASGCTHPGTSSGPSQ